MWLDKLEKPGNEVKSALLGLIGGELKMHAFFIRNKTGDYVAYMARNSSQVLYTTLRDGLTCHGKCRNQSQCAPAKYAAIVLTRGSYRGFVYDTELLKQQTSLTDFIYNTIPTTSHVPLSAIFERSALPQFESPGQWVKFCFKVPCENRSHT